jgi:hypothetical protein
MLYVWTARTKDAPSFLGALAKSCSQQEQQTTQLCPCMTNNTSELEGTKRLL